MGWGLSRAFRVWLFPLIPQLIPLLLHLHCHSLHPGHQHPCPGPLTTLQWIVPWPCRMQPGGWMRVKKKCRGHKLVCTFRHGRPSEAPSALRRKPELLNSPASSLTTQHCLSRFFFHFSPSLKMPLSASSAWKAPCSKISSLLLIPIHHLRLSLYVTSSGNLGMMNESIFIFILWSAQGNDKTDFYPSFYPSAWQGTFLLDGHLKKICAVLWWTWNLVPIWVLPSLILKVTSMVTLSPFSSVKWAQRYPLCSTIVRIRDKIIKCTADNCGFNFLSAYSLQGFGERKKFLTLCPSVMLN